MKLYILSTGEYSDWTMLGVYSSREKAEAEKAFFEAPYPVNWDDEPQTSKANDIWEVELDRRVPVEWLYGHPWSKAVENKP